MKTLKVFKSAKVKKSVVKPTWVNPGYDNFCVIA